jgi:penicillin-insensitive murein DD-endopeptidase
MSATFPSRAAARSAATPRTRSASTSTSGCYPPPASTSRAGSGTPAHHRLLEAAARDPEVERIFVTGAVKLQMCADAPGRDRAWLAKIRPWWGHDTHFHVRLDCPAGQAGCTAPDPLPAGDGCAEAVWWVTEALEPPDPNTPPPPPKPPVRLADLPSQCAAVLGRAP